MTVTSKKILAREALQKQLQYNKEARQIKVWKIQFYDYPSGDPKTFFALAENEHGALQLLRSDPDMTEKRFKNLLHLTIQFVCGINLMQKETLNRLKTVKL